jgi:hypothetical protein
MKLRHRIIRFRRFETTYFPYLKLQKFPLDMEDEDSSVSRIFATDYSVTRRHIPKKQYLQLYRCENLRIHTFPLTQKVNCPSIACCRNVISFLGAFARLRKATTSFMSVRLSAWNNSTPTRRIFVKLDICGFFENLSRKFKFH